MDELVSKIDKIEDEATRQALMIFAEELLKIKAIPPISEDITQAARAINKITGKL